MKKILYITFKSPYPDVSGYPIRALNIGKALARKYEVDLLFLSEDVVSRPDLRELHKHFHKVIPFYFPRTRFLFNGLLGFLSQRPLQVEYYYNHRVREWVKEHYRQYDLLFCSTIRTIEYVRGLKKKKAVDLIDDLTLSYGEFYPYAPLHWKIAYFIDWLRVKRYHRLVLSQFKKIFITSHFDANHLNSGLESPLSNITVLPNGVREELLFQSGDSPSFSAGTVPAKTIVIFGSMNYLPNRDGALYFARDIFTELRQRFPSLELEIIGRHPPRDFKQMAAQGVHAFGFVEDPYVHIRNAALVISPLRAGAGIPNKILEAMALKKANVISPVAARGLEGEDGTHYLVAKNKKEWIDKISTLLNDSSLRRHLGENAHGLVQGKYRWNTIGDRLLKEISQILD